MEEDSLLLCTYATLRCGIPVTSPLHVNISTEISIPDECNEFFSFLKFITPAAVSDLQGFKALWEKAFNRSITIAISAVCIIKRLYPAVKAISIVKHKNKDEITEAFNTFNAELLRYTGFKLSDKSQFLTLILTTYLCFLVGPINTISEKSKKALNSIIEILNDKIQMSKAQQQKMLSLLASNENIEFEKFLDELSFHGITQGPFSGLSKEAYIDLLSKIYQESATISTSDIYFALRNGKRSTYYSSYSELHSNVIDFFLSNIENNLDYTIFNRIESPTRDKRTTIIYFPSPIFLKKWKYSHSSNNTIFVYPDEMCATFAISELSNRKEGIVKGSFSIVTIPEVMNKIPDTPCDLIIFGTEYEQQSIQYIPSLPQGSTVWGISPDKFLESPSSFLGSLISTSKFSLDHVHILPTGLCDSYPFVECIWHGVFTNNDTSTIIHKMGKFRTSKGQIFIFKKNEQILYDNLKVFFRNGHSLRNISNQGKGGTKHAQAKYFALTKEFGIFYNLLPSSKQGYVRLETYVRDYLSTPVTILKDSKVHTEIPENNLESYLRSIYPVQCISKKIGDRVIGKSIYQIISTMWRTILESKPLTWGAFVYLYKNETIDTLSSDSKLREDILAILQTGVSDMMMQDITAEQYEEIFDHLSDTNIDITSSIEILEKFVQIAQETGHCNKNTLQILMTSDNKYAKKRGEVIDAIGVRSLEPEELRRILADIKDLFYEEKTPESLCAFLRVSSGLSLKHLLALKWTEYEKYTHYIMVN